MTHSPGSNREKRHSGSPWPRWLLALLVIAAVLAGTAAARSAQEGQNTATPGPTLSQPTPQSTLPPYVGQDINQMTPIIIGGAILVLIILAGTFGTSRRHT